MRNFLREIKAASELDPELPATEFSWSLSRHERFRRCERGYFLHYYFAQGGWDRYADSLVHMAYAAKKSLSYTWWLGEVTNRVLEEAVDRVRFLAPGARLRRFRNCFEDYLLEEFDHLDSVRLFDFPLPAEDLLRKAQFDAAGAFRMLVSSSVFGMLLRQQRSNFLHRNEEYEAYCDGVRVWFDPGLRWEEPGTRCSLRILYSQYEEESCRQAADLFSWYSRERFGSGNTLSFFLARDGEEWKIFSLSGHAGSAEELMRESMVRMKRKIRPGGTVLLSDFPEIGLPEVCRECRFVQVCSLLREL